jgi:hypothetical protein
MLDTSTSNIKFFFISPPGEWLKRILTQPESPEMTIKFIACDSELVSALGSNSIKPRLNLAFKRGCLSQLQ